MSSDFPFPAVNDVSGFLDLVNKIVNSAMRMRLMRAVVWLHSACAELGVSDANMDSAVQELLLVRRIKMDGERRADLLRKSGSSFSSSCQHLPTVCCQSGDDGLTITLYNTERERWV